MCNNILGSIKFAVKQFIFYSFTTAPTGGDHITTVAL